ncbi:MAG: glutaminyl-peptide cyclotransferase [Janthinobacterium lividum]
MNKKYILIGFCAVVTWFGCKQKSNNQAESTYLSISPLAGSNVTAGKDVSIQLSAPADYKVDSVVYQMDDRRLGVQKDLSAFNLKTDTLPLGIKQITATIYQGKNSTPTTTNIVLLANKAPEELTYQVEKIFPHDSTCYTEGLLYQDGFLFESGGGRSKPKQGEPADGQSSLRRTDLVTGKVLQKVMVDPTVFAEGISIVGNKIIQLTYTEKIGYVYDKTSFKLLSTFNNNVGEEGWGMCFDGKKLYMDDKTNRIWFLNKDNYQQTGFIDVYDDKKAIDSINELEYIDGKLYANVYTTNDILVIDPKTGAVLQKIDLTNLYPDKNPSAEVLNGIAYDAATKRIFITGKKWAKLFQVKFMKKGV